MMLERCPVCSSPSPAPRHARVPDFEHGTGVAVDFAGCGACGSVFEDPQPGLQELLSYYPVDYRPHVSGKASGGLLALLKGVQARLLARKYGRWLPDRGKRIIELGCGSGGLLLALRQAGYRELLGVDRNPALAANFEGSGVRFEAMELEPDFRLEQKAHTIVMNYVLEHFLDPARVLERCRESLEPGGQVLILTPNAASLSHAVFGRFWSGLHAPRHPVVFTSESLAALARRLGFARVELAQAPDPASWAISFQNWVQSRRGAGPQAGLSRGTAWYTLAGLPFWYPFAWLERRLGRSASMIARLG